MCLILDACVAGRAFAQPPGDDFKLVMTWLLAGPGGLVIGGKLSHELRQNTHALAIFAELKRNSRLFQYSGAGLDNELAALSTSLRSNDAHVLALARCSGARLLATDDTALIADFKDRRLVPPPAGRILPRKPANQRRLLYGASKGHSKGCPQSKSLLSPAAPARA